MRRIVLSFLMFLGVAGCGNSQPGGTISWRSDTERTQPFSSGYISKLTSGEWDVVLIQDPSRTAQPGRANAPIQPSKEPPIRQVLCIHIYYRSDSRMGSDHPAALNASLTWYVVNGDASAGPTWIKYNGAGFVMLSPGNGRAELEIVDADMTRSASRGSMTDPVGNAKIHGRAVMLEDDADVKEMIAQMKALTATTKP